MLGRQEKGKGIWGGRIAHAKTDSLPNLQKREQEGWTWAGWQEALVALLMGPSLKGNGSSAGFSADKQLTKIYYLPLL